MRNPTSRVFLSAATITALSLLLVLSGPAEAQFTVSYRCDNQADSGGSEVQSLTVDYDGYSSSDPSSNCDVAASGTGSDTCSQQVLIAMASILKDSGSAPDLDTVRWIPATGGASSQDFTLEEFGSISNDSARKTVNVWILQSPNRGTDGTGDIVFYFNDPDASPPPTPVTAKITAGVVEACGAETLSSTSGKGTGTNAQVGIVSATGALLVDALAVDGNITQTNTRTLMWDLLGGSAVSTNLRGAATRKSSTSSFEAPAYTLSASEDWVQAAVTVFPRTENAIELAEFQAIANDRGGVQLRWHTGREVDTVGFNVYRDDGARRVRVNAGPIAGSALTYNGLQLEAGYSYAWFDSHGEPSSLYWLEEIGMTGTRATYGPFSAEPGGAKASGPVDNSPLLSDLSALARASTPHPKSSTHGGFERQIEVARDRGMQWELASQDAVKLWVSESGWHRVTEQQLAAVGMNTSKVRPERLQLFSDGIQQAIQVHGAADGTFDPGDAIEFYGEAKDSLYDHGRVYWLIEGDGVGLRVSVQDESHLKDAPLLDYPATIQRHDRLFYVFGVLNGDDENFFGDLLFDTPVDLSLSVSSLADGGQDGLLTLAVQGFTDVPHSVSVRFNGQTIGSMSLTGAGWHHNELTVPSALLVEGPNTLTLIPDPAVDAIALFDYARLTYTRQSVADGDRAEVVVPMRQLAEPLSITGFSTDAIRVIDVTDPRYPIEVLGAHSTSETGHSVTVRAAEPVVEIARDHVLLAVTASNILTPEVSINTPSSWHSESNTADMVVITHSDFAQEVAPLVLLRENQGLQVAVVDVHDLYDEFSFGEKSAHAIRSFLRRAFSQWQVAPRWVLLVGDASYDPKNYLGFSEDFVPTKLADSNRLETASDDWYVDVDLDTAPDIAIGRLPVSSPAEAATVVTKIVQGGGAFSADRVMFVADDASGDNFASINDRLAAALPATANVQTVAIDDVGASVARASLLGAFTDAVPLIHYSGHGTVDTLSNGLLAVSDADGLGSTQGLVTLMDCLSGMYHEPLLEGLGEALVNRPNAGPTVVLSSTGITSSREQEALMTAFYDALSAGSVVTVGEAMNAAKAAVDPETRNTWILIGDPATRVVQ